VPKKQFSFLIYTKKTIIFLQRCHMYDLNNKIDLFLNVWNRTRIIKMTGLNLKLWKVYSPFHTHKL